MKTVIPVEVDLDAFADINECDTDTAINFFASNIRKLNDALLARIEEFADKNFPQWHADHLAEEKYEYQASRSRGVDAA